MSGPDDLARQRMARLDVWLDELDAALEAPSAEATTSAADWFASATAALPE